MAYYKENWNFKVVKTGDSINTGSHSLNFLQTPMVHWPDSMVTYMPEEKILFSNDAFGQHIASNERFDDEIGLDKAIERSKDYYANIIFHLGSQVSKVLSDASKLDISLIAPSHGVMWREYIPNIVGCYSDWADNKTDEKKAVIVYDTMWGSTKILADRISDRFKADGISSKVFSLKEFHISEVMEDLLDAQYICVGSSTLNNNLLPSVAAFLTYMKGLSPKKRKAIAFGSYGWSGESICLIEDVFKACKFDLLENVKAQYRPD